jgi:hypothetical protein
MKNSPILIVMFLFALFGVWQFSDGVRTVDVVGLVASGALIGAAAARFLAMRNIK